MKKPLITLSLAGAALCASSVVSAYQVEAGGSIGRVDYDVDDDTVINLHGRYFLENIVGGAGPLLEEPFMAKASWVQADFDDYGEGEALSVSGRYMFDPSQDLFAVAEVVSADDDSFQPDRISAGAGMYLTDRSAATLSLARVDYFDEDGLLVQGDYHQLLTLGSGNDISLDARAAIGEYTLIGGGATFHVSELLGLGVSLDLYNHDDVDISDLGLRVDFFYSDEVQLFAEYSTAEYEFDGGGDIDVDTILFGAYVRF